jgi:hypothetical protein
MALWPKKKRTSGQHLVEQVANENLRQLQELTIRFGDYTAGLYAYSFSPGKG